MNADIFRETNLSGVTVDTTGSSFDVTRLARKSVHTFVNAGSAVTLNVQASPNNSNWTTLDTKTYESGTAVQTDVFQYNGHIDYLRTETTDGSGCTVTTWITGRGV